MSSGNPPSCANRFGELIAPLRAEFNALHDTIASRDEDLKRLQDELSLYKNAYEHTSGRLARIHAAKEEAEKQRNVVVLCSKEAETGMEEAANGNGMQPKGRRAVVLIDGNGAMFGIDYISRGKPGGHEAAEHLRTSIARHLRDGFGSVDYQIWAYIFFSKLDLLANDSLMYDATHEELDSFTLAFNQTNERFTILDLAVMGFAKEFAEAKLRALLEDEVHMSDTSKIYLGGCHNSGYASTLRNLIVEGHKNKFVLLRDNSDMASEVAKLDLQEHNMPGLLMSTKELRSLWDAPNNMNSMGIRALSPVFSPPGLSDFGFAPDGNPVPDLGVSRAQSSRNPLLRPLANAQEDGFAARNLANRGTPRNCTFDKDRSAYVSPPTTYSQPFLKLDPAKPCYMNDPRPCLSLYLLDYCPHGEECKFSHEYDVSAEEEVKMRKDAKKLPCRHSYCTRGDNCIYGHTCPRGRACEYYKNGRCKFGGGDLHRY